MVYSVENREGCRSLPRNVSPTVVVTTGYTRKPNIPVWPGQEHFQGRLLHSSAYRSGERYRGQRVLVVGFGNSGGEIALDLWEHGAQPEIAVRSPVNVVPRDLLGIPILGWSLVLARLPSRVADLLAAPLLRLAVGDLRPYGLRQLPYGPITQIKEHGRIPLLDIGTLKLIKQGKLAVRPGIERLTATEVVFSDGRQQLFDAIILATGYRPELADFLKPVARVIDEQGVPHVSGRETALPGLYFCGFYVSPMGMLREIGIEAQQISHQIGIMPSWKDRSLCHRRRGW